MFIAKQKALLKVLVLGGPGAKKLAPNRRGTEAMEAIIVRGMDSSKELLYTQRVMH